MLELVYDGSAAKNLIFVSGNLRPANNKNILSLVFMPKVVNLMKVSGIWDIKLLIKLGFCKKMKIFRSVPLYINTGVSKFDMFTIQDPSVENWYDILKLQIQNTLKLKNEFEIMTSCGTKIIKTMDVYEIIKKNNIINK